MASGFQVFLDIAKPAFYFFHSGMLALLNAICSFTGNGAMGMKL